METTTFDVIEISVNEQPAEVQKAPDLPMRQLLDAELLFAGGGQGDVQW